MPEEFGAVTKSNKFTEVYSSDGIFLDSYHGWNRDDIDISKYPKCRYPIRIVEKICEYREYKSTIIDTK